MSSTAKSDEQSPHVTASRTVRMSARPSADCTTTARPNGLDAGTGGSGLRPVVAAGSADHEASTALFEETHNDTDACGWAKRMNNSPPKTSSERWLATPGCWIWAQPIGANADPVPQKPASSVTPG